jgi:hypothetical protein
MKVPGFKRLLNRRLVVPLLMFTACLLIGFPFVSSTAQSEDGVIIVKGTYDNGFASMEWDRFIPAQIPGDPYCMRYQASSKNPTFSESPNFDMVLDLGQGTFSGSVSGNVQAAEFGWKATGSYNITGISGTIRRVDDDKFGDWELSGSGQATLQFYEEAGCPAEDAQGLPTRVIAKRSETKNITVQVTGRIGTSYLSGQTYDTWVWRPDITYASKEIRFRLTCGDCEIGVVTPSDELSVNLDCQPVSPQVEEPVSCHARVSHIKQDEELEFTWYVDSAKEADTKEDSWTWPSAEKGVHDITVYVQGEGRNTESTVTLEVGEEAELVASIGMDPPVPVLEKGVTFTPRVEGAKAGEKLSYRWFLDENLLCESTMCAWGEAQKGDHQVHLEVRGEAERLAVARQDFTVVTLVSKDEAGFRIVMMGCNSGISSDETLVCTLGLERDEGIGTLNVTWLIDGVVALTEAGVQAGSEMQLGQPAPGDHVVEAVVVDPLSWKAISGQTSAEVVEGKNALIPPRAQAGAAVGTLGVVGAWLWAEWLNARRAEAEEARLRQQQRPSWMDDKRSLKEIWDAEVAAERARRPDLWGFEYNEDTGVFKQPDWTYGKAPLWWDKSWDLEKMRSAWKAMRVAHGVQTLRADRSLERDWMQEIAAEKSFNERRKDWIYNAEIDAWEKAPWHKDEIEKKNRALLLTADRAIDKLLDMQPVSLWGKVEAMQERFLTANSPNGEGLSRMMRLRGALYDIQQAKYEHEKIAAELDALDAQAYLVGAKRMRMTASIMSVAVGLSPLLLGGAGWALGATTLTNAAAAVSGAMAQLGAFRLTMNLVEGATVGYLEGGLNAAVVGGMRRTLPINTMSLWLGPRQPGGKGPTWTRIGLSVLQDVGNAMTLKRGIAQYRQLARRAGESISNAYQRLTGTGEQPLRMPPVRNSVLLKQDTQWWTDREEGQRLVNQFNQTLRKMNAATSRLERAQLSNQLTRQAIKINETYAAKSILKVIKRPALTRAFDQRIQRIYRVVDYRVAKQLSSEGFTRGGQAFTRNDLMNFRNASSYGTVGMDRDVGLNEMLVQKWQGVVNQAQPGTEWHAHAVAKLRQAQRITQLGKAGQRISLAKFNERAQEVYNDVYGQVTGGNAEKASQMLTTSGNVEAYKDMNVLQNNPVSTPFSGQWAEQTGSVSAVKVYENFELVNKGLLSSGNAIQESARGLAKDIATKLVPLLKANPNVNPAQITYWQGMQRLLGEAGKGNVTPGQLLQTLNTDTSGIIRMAERVSAGIQGAIQY